MRFEDNISRLGQLISAPIFGTVLWVRAPNRHIVLIAEEWKSFSVFATQSQKECSSEPGKNFTRALSLPCLVIVLSFLPDQNTRMLLWVANMKGRQANMSQRPGLFRVCLYATPGFCISGGLHGLSSCCWTGSQSVNQPVVRQVRVPCCYLCWAGAYNMQRACLPCCVFPFLTESSNLFLWQESCLTAACRSWKKKPVTKASFPFTAIVLLKQGAEKSAKYSLAGFSGGPMLLLPLLLTCCCLLFVSPQLGPRTGGQGSAFVLSSNSTALMKLDKWIIGAQIWAGIFEKRQQRCWRGAGVGRDRKRQRHLCCWTTRGRVCCKKSLLLPKETRQW